MMEALSFLCGVSLSIVGDKMLYNLFRLSELAVESAVIVISKYLPFTSEGAM